MSSAYVVRTGHESLTSSVASRVDRRPSRSSPDLYDLLGYRRRWRLLSLTAPPYVSDTAPHYLMVVEGPG